MPGAVHTWNSEHYFQWARVSGIHLFLAFTCLSSRSTLRSLWTVLRLRAIVSTEGTNGLRYSRDFAYQVIARELALALTYKKAPGPSATEGRWLTRGDWRCSWFAERQVCSAHSVPLLIMLSPFFCPLIIDPAGRAVPAGLGATLIGSWF